LTQSNQPDGNPAYDQLTGTWRAEADTSFTLIFSQICCGSRPALKGSIRHGGQHLDLDPPSYANMYPIRKPDSSTAYAFELFLTSPLDPICTIDGFVQDKAGKKEFAQPTLPDSAFLALTISAKGSKGCDSVWAPMLFKKQP
jgi:hypothetical protein